ncbi:MULTISPECIES: cytochrome-c oxidase, cbb3-type subunit III [Sphingomonas]|uniref:cytochrome-c oxidase, cbb3-type subunit III n=1 Tax=Sphingomonas TaxID=13687 RepID=UPI000F7F81B1|nr:cytochrome-c oxidase, cbb3-type subunit III [Sphingomonas sp. ABOLF]RSV16305.1 cytochrome-c oxidase, cbb3-type subunit III [Sphingomonas sp. ABOLF]GLK21426.1 Cbb3-type cytochrome c oxidase subunit CcoP [Microbacterium terregens]
MVERKRIDDKTGTSTVGHEWDGIEELDTPMPRWWLITFFASIVFAAVYVVLYPAWPLVHSATAGVLGWSSRGQLAKEVASEGDRKAPIEQALARIQIERLPENSELFQAAVAGGSAAFKVHCVQCHGAGAAGSKGYPNLNDDDWLWGGDLKTIQQTLANGIRQPGNDATRMSVMPAFGRDGILQPADVQDVVSYVRVISGQEKPSEAARRGAAQFANNCVACHGPQGKGMREFGAPNLTDGIWLYGGDRDSLTQTVTNSRYGVMPAWGHRLDPVTIKMLAAYVHSLGGGEAFVPETPATVAAATSNPEAATPVAQPRNVQP